MVGGMVAAARCALAALRCALRSPVLEVRDEDEVCVDDEVRHTVEEGNVARPEDGDGVREARQREENADVADGDPKPLAVTEQRGGGVEVRVVGLVAVLDGARGVGDQVRGPAG